MPSIFNKPFRLPLALFAALTLTACMTETSSPTPAPASELVSVASNGGCARPNLCLSFTVNTDGSYRASIGMAGRPVFHKREDGARLMAPLTHSGEIAPERLTRLTAQISGMDFGAFLAPLGKGEMRAAYDGIDKIYTVTTPEKTHMISSVDYALPPAHPLFVLLERIEQDAYTQTLAEGVGAVE